MEIGAYQKLKFGRRVINWHKVSSVQYLGYYRNKLTREEMCIHVDKYREGLFYIPGLDGIYTSLQEVTDKVLSTY